MNLWTWQTPDFDLVGGKIDHSKSKYYIDSQSIRDAYAELERRIGTNKLVWCFTTEESALSWRDDGRQCWLLRVPDHLVLRVDDYIWHRIINKPYVPRNLEHAWELNEMSGGPSVAEAAEQFHSRFAVDELWDHLFLTSTSSAATTDVCAVVEHPLQPSWVVRVFKKRGR